MRESKIQGNKKVGRSTLKWLEDEENDSQELNMMRWSQKASNREEWAPAAKETKVLQGP